MAYSVIKGKVTSNDVPPVEEKETVYAEEVEVPLKDRCPHGFYVHSACHRCNPPKNFPVVASSFIDVEAWSPLKIGDKVCRRIRTNEIGTVTSITYVFQDSKCMRDIWIAFCEQTSRSTPYKPEELLQVRVQ